MEVDLTFSVHFDCILNLLQVLEVCDVLLILSVPHKLLLHHLNLFLIQKHSLLLICYVVLADVYIV
jgi:hypothetical protein